MTSDDDIRGIARKVWAGTASPEEREVLRRFLEEHGEEGSMHLLLDERAPEARIVLSREEKRRMTVAILGRQTVRLWPGYAAAALVIIIGSVAVFRPHKAARPVVYSEGVAPRGQRTTINLPDGTKVFLNAGSRLRYPAATGDGARQVYLEGEAFFDVARDDAHPFIVRTPRIKTTVLGTSFDLRDYADDATGRVQLKTGKVRVETKDTSLVLNPEQQINEDGKITAVDAGDIGGWVENRLIFNNEPVGAILHELERIYNVRFMTKDASVSDRYTVRFEKMTIDRTLETLSVLTNLTFTKKDSTITVSPLH